MAQEQRVEDYLESVNRCLKPLDLHEREDIIREIRSHIEEKIRMSGKGVESVLKELGRPSDLAAGYVGKSIADNPKFNIRHLLRMISFYSIIGLKGMFIIPFASILSISLYVCSIITVAAGLIKTGGAIVGYEIPYIQVNLGFGPVPSILVLPVCIIFAVLFYFLGRKLWQFLKGYLNDATKQFREFN